MTSMSLMRAMTGADSGAVECQTPSKRPAGACKLSREFLYSDESSFVHALTRGLVACRCGGVVLDRAQE